MEKFFDSVIATVTGLATEYIFKIILALVILFVGIKIVKMFIKGLSKTKSYAHLDDAVKSFLNSFIKILGNAVVFIAAATTLGVPATSFITILASCGVAIGLALQGSLSNLAGGIMILVFKPFKMGDYISSGGNEGTVTDINILYTKLTTPDNKVVTIPNGALSNSAVVDVTANDTRRVDINLGVSYDSNIKDTLTLLKAIGDNCSVKLDNEETMVAVTGYSDSSINVTLRIWTKTSDYWTALFEMNEAVKSNIDNKKLNIPYPQMDVHISK